MIVIAENDDSTRVVLEHALQRSGYRVLAVADGNVVWPAIMHDRAELLLLDLRMPGLNGWEVLRRLREARRTKGPSVRLVPVIVISGQSDPETEQFPMRLGADAFLAKPIDLATLTDTVRQVLARATS